jgi:hypothetical protein
MTRACVAVALVLAACSGAPDSPRAVVDEYFRTLAHDPLRTLPLLSPAFHRQHGVHVVTTDEARLRRGEAGDELLLERIALDRFELGWLMIQSRETFATALAALVIEPLGDESNGATARVTVRATPGHGQPFEQIFTLARDARGVWHIEGIEQRGVEPGNALAAFVAHPTEAARVRLEASLHP